MLLDYNHMPAVSVLMRSFPYYAYPQTPVADIIDLMDQHQIRHIPIKQGDRIIGIVSERDLRWLRNPELELSVTQDIPVRQVMTYNPYIADINTPLPTVIDQMTKQKIGAAIIIRANKLAGIVTTTDLCQALSELLKSEFTCVY